MQWQTKKRTEQNSHYAPFHPNLEPIKCHADLG